MIDTLTTIPDILANSHQTLFLDNVQFFIGIIFSSLSLILSIWSFRRTKDLKRFKEGYGKMNLRYKLFPKIIPEITSCINEILDQISNELIVNQNITKINAKVKTLCNAYYKKDLYQLDNHSKWLKENKKTNKKKYNDSTEIENYIFIISGLIDQIKEYERSKRETNIEVR